MPEPSRSFSGQLQGFCRHPVKHAFVLTFVAAGFACLSAHADSLDFGDQSSATITGKAWEALAAKNYDNAVAYAKKCVELYEKQAVEMQKDLKEPVGPDDHEAVFKKWALNDVGTCLYIMGQALEKQDKRKAELVKLRFFAGLTIAQAAGVLGIATSTADNDWAYAKTWLRLAMLGGDEAAPEG